VNKTLNSTLNLMIDDPPSYEELAGLAARLDKVYVESAFRALTMCARYWVSCVRMCSLTRRINNEESLRHHRRAR
jgi:hypothetical protein